MNFISFISVLAFTALVQAQDISSLCGQSRQQNQISFSNQVQPRSNEELTLITWNAHKFSDSDFFLDLKRLSKTTDVILIQEAMHSSELQTDFTLNLPFDFSFHKSFCMPGKQATGVLNSSRLKLFNNLTLVAPDSEPILLTPKVSAYSQILLNGQVVHLINTHALNFNAGGPYQRQIYHVAKFISQLSGPVIWAGDFNTWNPDRKNYLNKITATLNLEHLRPENDSRRLVLDHIYARGFRVLKTEVLIEDSSDHYPIKAVLRLK